MYLMVCTVANRYTKANYTCTSIVHHVTGNFFITFDLTFLTFLNRKLPSFEVLATYNNEITLDIMLPTSSTVHN